MDSISISYEDEESPYYYFQVFYNSCRSWTKWFLHDATFSLNFDDLMMLMTLFVLFADSIKVIYLEKTAGRIPNFSQIFFHILCYYIFSPFSLKSRQRFHYRKYYLLLLLHRGVHPEYLGAIQNFYEEWLANLCWLHIFVLLVLRHYRYRVYVS